MKLPSGIITFFRRIPESDMVELETKELILCKECMAFDDKRFVCLKNQMIAVGVDDWYSRAERKEK